MLEQSNNSEGGYPSHGFSPIVAIFHKCGIHVIVDMFSANKKRGFVPGAKSAGIRAPVDKLP